ncbi:hypothetical protein X975_12310, partial [Stegodyphus mimosarum]
MLGRHQRRHFQQIDDFTRGMVIGLRRAGWSLRQIAVDTHMNVSTVHQLWHMVVTRKCGKKEGCRCSQRDVSTRGSTLPPKSCGDPASHLYSDSAACARYPGCSRVDENHFPSRRLPLTPQHRRQRLEWYQTGAMWMTEWRNVVFSDESRFCLSSDNRRIRVCRRRGDRSNSAVTEERLTVQQCGIMVWGAIVYDSRSPLVRIQGTITAQRYLDNVLRP